MCWHSWVPRWNRHVIVGDTGESFRSRIREFYKKGKVFLTVKIQMINVEGRMELQNHYLVNTIIITDPSKKIQWVLTLGVVVKV